MITQSRLMELIRYDPETGLLKWNIDRRKVFAGDVAGWRSHGYIRIRIDGSCYYAHRLVFLYMTGVLPESGVDHINMNGEDNRWCNLRLADQSENMCNAGRPRHNTSGTKGVSFNKNANKWQANIRFRGQSHHLGYYDTLSQAAMARQTATNRIHGEYARHE